MLLINDNEITGTTDANSSSAAAHRKSQKPESHILLPPRLQWHRRLQSYSIEVLQIFVVNLVQRLFQVDVAVSEKSEWLMVTHERWPWPIISTWHWTGDTISRGISSIGHGSIAEYTSGHLRCCVDTLSAGYSSRLHSRDCWDCSTSSLDNPAVTHTKSTYEDAFHFIIHDTFQLETFRRVGQIFRFQSPSFLPVVSRVI